MATKVKTYGRKKGQDLAAFFNNLTLDLPKKNAACFESPKVTAERQPKRRTEEGEQERPVLAPRSANAINQQPKLHAKNDSKVPNKESAAKTLHHPVYDPKVPITALTSLQSVSPEIYGFEQQCDNWEKTLNIKKIAQGSYATILRTQKKDDPDVYTIVKLIPLRRPKGKGSRRKDHMSIEDAAAETKLLAAMASIDGFVEFRSAHILIGVLPPLLAEIQRQWEADHPDDVADLKHEKNQLWLLMEMTDAGTDLETLLEKGCSDEQALHSDHKGSTLTVHQAWDIFWGAAGALAMGEKAARFEHRDLHPGNVCIKMSLDIRDDSINGCVNVVQRYTDIQVTLIDYTLSRADLGGEGGGEVLANSMKDASIFEQHSENEIDERQYETYRNMREMIRGQQENRSSRIDWRAFVPSTNLLWLQHLLVILCKVCRSTSISSADKNDRSDKKARLLLESLEKIRDGLQPDCQDHWQYVSAEHLVAEESELEDSEC